MTSVNVTNLSTTVVVAEDNASVVTIATQGPQGNAAPGVPTFLQATQPTVTQLMDFTQYLWWDTSNGDLTLWLEDGAS